MISEVTDSATGIVAVLPGDEMLPLNITVKSASSLSPSYFFPDICIFEYNKNPLHGDSTQLYS
jgi:hypothetical protein